MPILIWKCFVPKEKIHRRQELKKERKMQKTLQLNWKIQNVKTVLAEAKAHYAYSVQNPSNLPKSMDTHRQAHRFLYSPME